MARKKKNHNLGSQLDDILGNMNIPPVIDDDEEEIEEKQEIDNKKETGPENTDEDKAVEEEEKPLEETKRVEKKTKDISNTSDDPFLTDLQKELQGKSESNKTYKDKHTQKTVYIDNEVYDVLDKVSEKTGRTFNSLINTAAEMLVQKLAPLLEDD